MARIPLNNRYPNTAGYAILNTDTNQIEVFVDGKNKNILGDINNYIRSDTLANWQTSNPTLALGEEGYIIDTNEFVIGDGQTPFNNLKRFLNETQIATTTSNGFMSSSDKSKLNSMPVISTQVYTSGYNKILIDGVEKLLGSEVVEQGSNANGNYVKYENGIMICYNNNGASYITDKARGSIWGSDWWSYPLPSVYVNTNYTIHTFAYSIASWTAAEINPVLPTSSIRIQTLSYLNTQNVPIGFFTIGRWK